MWHWKNAEVFNQPDYRWTNHTTHSRLPVPIDIDNALQALMRLMDEQHPEIVPLFDRHEPLVAARAPGRLDVMGGIADYSGSTVLQLPLAESAVVLSQTTSDSMIRIISVDVDDDQRHRVVLMPVDHLLDANSGLPLSILAMQKYFSSLDDERRWAAYIAGVLPVLTDYTGLRLQQGLALFVHSTVPEGKGVSSSAAIEVATMRTVTVLEELSIDAHQQALLCQRVENQIVGAPCGLMDQMTSSLGQQGTLLRLLCQPDIVEAGVTLPENLSVWGIDSGIRHAVSGADYGTVRIAAFMGYRLLLDIAGVAGAETLARNVCDNKWGGYLANVSVAEYEEFYASLIPESMRGEAFLQRFDATTDSVTQVLPDVDYAVQACTAHPIYEHRRVRRFADLCLRLDSEIASLDVARQMGDCLYQSHASYSACGLGSPGTDDIVRRLQMAGVDKGIYGARITGGGSGGTVAVLADTNAGPVIEQISQAYAQQSGIGGQVFSGSSDGASIWRLEPVSNTSI